MAFWKLRVLLRACGFGMWATLIYTMTTTGGRSHLWLCGSEDILKVEALAGPGSHMAQGQISRAEKNALAFPPRPGAHPGKRWQPYGKGERLMRFDVNAHGNP